ncbi:MAG: Gfo/Idh/MocA family protein [Spirochaetota bacterium]
MGLTRVKLVGLGGYGNGYVGAVLDRAGELGVELAGAVDPDPSGCLRRNEVRAAAGTIHTTIDEFFAEREADLAVISAPIPLHAPFTVAAIEHGASVLCEKPVAGVIQDALTMERAEREARRARAGESSVPRDSLGPKVAIGYQWSFSNAIQAIRRDVAAGRFGVPLQLKTLVFWPRGRAYYRRSGWAGAIRTEAGWVLDSPVNNATAHYLHNMLFVLGGEGGRPLSVSAELYRANPGAVEDLGSPEVTHAEKLAKAARSVRDGTPVACTISDATHQLRVACGAHESHPIVDFPEELVRVTPLSGGPAPSGQGDEMRWVEGLQAAFTQAFTQGALPSELGSFSWAQPGRSVDLSDYDTFPSKTHGI